ncbi:MAG: ABC transporter permease [Lachnospiraceae bacterium]|nr:ABC transporter permease [Lachnospiraceae bacterium]
MARDTQKKKYWQPLIMILLILIIWQIACSLHIWTEYILPPPSKVWKSFSKMFLSGDLFVDIRISLKRVFIGFFIAFMLAFSLGMTASLKPSLSGYYNWFVQFMRNVPPLSLIALLILWFGIGETSKIIIIVLASFFPMFLNIEKGFSQCDKKLIEVGASFHFSKREQFFRIILPNAIPDILVGMRIGLGYSWRAIIGAEMIAASTGLGHMILYAQQMSRSDKVIIGIIMIGLVGLICDKIFAVIISRLVKGDAENVWS